METLIITRDVLKALDETQIAGMNKTDLAAHLNAAVRILQAAPDKGPGRKDEVLAIMRKGPISILDIAKELDTSTKNVSSQLSYLRKDGWVIHTDHKQRKILVGQETPSEDKA